MLAQLNKFWILWEEKRISTERETLEFDINQRQGITDEAKEAVIGGR